MRLTSDSGDFVELEPRLETRDADLHLAVRVLRDGFIGEADTWVERHSWFAFAQALTILEERRSGNARVESMSPGEFELTVKSLDRLGHLGAEGLVGKRGFDRKIALRFSVFEFDPSQIAPFSAAARHVSERLGSGRTA